MNREGCSRKPPMMEAEIFPCFLSISTLNLLADTNAISMPEKKAESTKQINIAMA
jgi:hypothetical protein